MKLKHPVKIGDKTISDVEENRIKGKHLKQAMSLDSSDQAMYLIAIVTGLSIAEIDELDIEDFTFFSEVIESQMGKQKDGEKSKDGLLPASLSL